MAEKGVSFLAKAKSWASKNGLFGPQAFLKYVILNFVESINACSDDFVFKGGNLLWIYIKTPRQTVDLDFVTKSLKDPSKIKQVIVDACRLGKAKGIEFSLKHFDILEEKNSQAASAVIEYKTNTGAKNTFELDIAFATQTDDVEIPSPLDNKIQLIAASIENIIADKLAASAQFEAGNTRMKDFDDLWRISKAKTEMKSKTLSKVLKLRRISAKLDKAWLNPAMSEDWKRHSKKYKDLPSEIDIIFDAVNEWLDRILA